MRVVFKKEGRMSKKELSVVIPAYNAENFIERAINSILFQKIEQEKLEIIVVENGSNDNTTSVVEAISKKVSCVKLMHSKKGVSNARNKGIDEATGKWLMFLDADDILIDEVTADELKVINEENADIFFYGHRTVAGDKPVCDDSREEIFTEAKMESCKVKVLKNPTRYMQAISKIYSRKFLCENEIKFNSSLRLSEDSEFLFRCLQKAKCVQFKNKIIYEAIPNTSSATRKLDGSKMQDYIYALKETNNYMQRESNVVREAFLIYILMHMNIAMVREVFSISNKEAFGDKYKAMCRAIKEPIFKNAIASTKMRECTSLRMAPILCMKIKCRPFAAFIYIVRALQNHIREN